MPKCYMDIRACVTLDSALRTAEIDMAKFMGGARFSLGLGDGSSMRQNTTLAAAYVWTNVDAVIDPLVAAARPCIIILGTDFPKGAQIASDLGVSTWVEINRPREAAWPYWRADHAALIAYVKAKYLAAGLNPADYVFIQMANEPNKGGAGGPWNASGNGNYSAPFAAMALGTYDRASDLTADTGRNLHAQLNYMAANLDKSGLLFLGPSIETQASDFAVELATIVNGDWLSYVDIPAFNHYPLLTYNQTGTHRAFVRAYYDSIMSVKAQIIAAVPSWASKPFALTEFGATMNMIRFGSGYPYSQFGHQRRWEYILALKDKLETCGEFAHISVYCTRERTSVADGSLYGAIKDDGTYTYGWRPFARRNGTSTASPPSGSYAGAASEVTAS
jgi:hypothetical protein